jgi:hypothetical protein
MSLAVKWDMSRAPTWSGLGYVPLTRLKPFDSCATDSVFTNSPRSVRRRWYASSLAGMSSRLVPAGRRHPREPPSSIAIPAPCPSRGKVPCAASPRRAARPRTQVGRWGNTRNFHRWIESWMGRSRKLRNFGWNLGNLAMNSSRVAVGVQANGKD